MHVPQSTGTCNASLTLLSRMQLLCHPLIPRMKGISPLYTVSTVLGEKVQGANLHYVDHCGCCKYQSKLQDLYESLCCQKQDLPKQNEHLE